MAGVRFHNDVTFRDAEAFYQSAPHFFGFHVMCPSGVNCASGHDYEGCETLPEGFYSQRQAEFTESG